METFYLFEGVVYTRKWVHTERNFFCPIISDFHYYRVYCAIIVFTTVSAASTISVPTLIDGTYLDFCFASNRTNNPLIFSLLASLLPHLHTFVRPVVIKILVNSPDLLVLFLMRASFSYNDEESSLLSVIDFTNEVN